MNVLQTIFGRSTERLLAATRVLLAAAALLAPSLDPQDAANPALCLLTALYLLIGLALLVTQSGVGRPVLAKFMHGFDLAYAAAMIASPLGGGYFMVLATFCLLSSAVQWRWPAVLLTGWSLFIVYLLAVTSGFVSSERMIIRATFLIVAPLGTALASHSAAASRNRLLKMARWSSGRYSDTEDAVLRVFRHAADVLEAEEVTVYFHEIDGLTCTKATYTRALDRLETAPCETWPDDTASAALSGQPFVLVDAKRALCLTYDGMKRVPDSMPATSMSSGAGVIASAPFTGDFCVGRLFASGIKSWRWDQIVLVEIVASHVRSRLEGRVLRDRTARITAGFERMRLARDLHDGILQNLTAARLQLNALIKEAPGSEPQLRQIAELLQDEQQNLREFVEEHRTAPGDHVPVTRIAERIALVAEHWRLKTNVEIDCADAEIPDALYREIYFIVGEAIANSARHGHATSLSARLSCVAGRFTLLLEEEDGAAARDADRRIVPRSIGQRIRDLGGALSISQGDNGVSLKVELSTHE